MKEGKNHNRIIFLTTLSVYLGLVLVGGVTPSVFAQAATRNFNVRDEVEIKDDLDKKPDDFDFAEADFPALFAELLSEIKTQVAAGKIALPLGEKFGVAADYQILKIPGSGGAFGGEVADAQLKQILQNTIEKRIYSGAAKSADFYQGTKTINITLDADASDWTLSVSFTKNKADKFADFLEKRFSRAASAATNVLTKKIYQNSSAQVNSLINQSISIQISLPRSAIDDYLADKNSN